MAAISVEYPDEQRHRTLADSFPGLQTPRTGTLSRQRQASLARGGPAIPLAIHYAFDELSDEQKTHALAWASYAKENDVTKTPSFQRIQKIEKGMQFVPYGLRRLFFRDLNYEAQVEALHRQQQEEREQREQAIKRWRSASIQPRLSLTQDVVGTYGFAFQMDDRHAIPTRHTEQAQGSPQERSTAPSYPQTQEEIKAYAAAKYKMNHPDDFRTTKEITAMLFSGENTRIEFGGYVKALIVQVIREAGSHLPQIVRDKAVELSQAMPEHMKVLFAENTDYRTIDGFSTFISKIYSVFSNLINRAGQRNAPLPQDLAINIV